MKKLLSGICFCLFCIGLALPAKAACDHYFTSDLKSGIYEDENGNLHTFDNWADPIDDKYHNLRYKCLYCNELKYTVEAHNFDSADNRSYEYFSYKDNEYHIHHVKCYICDGKVDLVEKHNYAVDSYQKKDSNYHQCTYVCKSANNWGERACNGTKYVDEKHVFEEPKDEYGFPKKVFKKIDNTYHEQKFECRCCGEEKWGNRGKHRWEYSYAKKEAAPGTSGIDIYKCSDCGATKSVKTKWNGEYDISEFKDYTAVYKTSRSITIWLQEPLKGGIVQVKIGKKTYKKKLKDSRKKIKIKIKKPKVGQKITMKLVYQGHTLIKESWNVLYARKIRKGLTKKQVKLTYGWGGPDDTASGSGGWSYWYYEDGSYIGFKRGRVRYWYNAAG